MMRTNKNNRDVNMSSTNKKRLFVFLFITAWGAMIFFAPLPLIDLAEYVLFSLVGLLGAIFANTTGAGGGVVFIPLFNQLDFTDAQSIATSFAIQCFGMTAGAITWWHHYKTEKTSLRLWTGFKRIITIASIASCLGLWVIYDFGRSDIIHPPASLHQNFSWFSLCLGLFILATVFLLKPTRERSQLALVDWFFLILIGFLGGALTAWLSVGVGELIAIYLIIRRFDINMAVAAAVIISAISVWAAIWQHTLINFQVFWQVVLFAGPSAVLGGILARTLVGYLSATRLKLFFAFWLLVIGLIGIKV
jgi:uncharacterized membrane protein YfcA